jgi:Zn-dependent protease with chaperone function
MGPVLGLMQLLLLATAGFVVGIALLSALVYPRLRGRLAALPPAQRARILRWTCAAPLGGAALLTGLCLLPSLLGIVWPELDHCLVHDGHLHLCLVHPPASLGGLLGWSVNGVFWGIVAAGIVAGARRALEAARSLQVLRQAAHYDAAVGAHLIRSALPFSAAVGLFRQQVVLSTALAAALPPALLRVVLAHEAAHVRRHDSFWQLLAALLATAHMPYLRCQLLADLALAAEQACDEDAATVTRDRLGVAQAILFVERMLGDRVRPLPLMSGFGGSDVAARVEALLVPPRRTRQWKMRAVEAGLVLALMALAPFDALHHWTETLLGLFAR